MRQNIWMLLISLLIPILGFSQNTSTTFPKITKDSLIVLTPLQLKKTNLIFVEHSQMKQQIPLLEKSIQIKDSLLIISNNSSFNQNNQIKYLKKSNSEKLNLIFDLENNIKKERRKSNLYKHLCIGSFSFGISLILFTILLK